jgi:hypothetical protein
MSEGRVAQGIKCSAGQGKPALLATVLRPMIKALDQEGIISLELWRNATTSRGLR